MADGSGTPAAPAVRDLVRIALEEDVGTGDLTTRWTVPASTRAVARIRTREHGVVAGMEPAGEVFRLAEPELEVEARVDDGRAVEEGDVLLELRGPLRGILTAERTALNFLGRLSGIATLTRRFVRELAGTDARVTDTRKTTPGWRRLEKAATRAGGAVNHRLGLHDMVLIKENHLRAAGGVAEALARAVPRAREQGVPVAVEVADLDQLEDALRGDPDRILLDNMSPEVLERAVERVRRRGEDRPALEASGGITLEDVRRIAETGVDLISVGALTHSAPALDLTLLVDRTGER